MKPEQLSSHRVDIIDASTELEDLLQFFVLDRQIERELNAVPSSQSPLSRKNMAPMPARPLHLARSSSLFRFDSSLYMKTAGIYEQIRNGKPLENMLLSASIPESSTALQDSIEEVYRPEILQYPVLPQTRPESSLFMIDGSYVSEKPDLDDSLTSSKAHEPAVVDPSASNTTKPALVPRGTPAIDHDEEEDEGLLYLAQRHQSRNNQTSSRAGGSQTKCSTRDKDFNDEDDLWDDHAANYNLSQIKLPKNSILQYIMNQMRKQDLEKSESIFEERHTATTIIDQEVDQALAKPNETTDSIDRGPSPACKKCLVETWLAEIYTENNDLTVDIPVYRPRACSHVTKAGVLAIVEADACRRDEEQNERLRRFEEDNAFIKFYLGISAEAASGIPTEPEVAIQKPFTCSPKPTASQIQRQVLPGVQLTDLRAKAVRFTHHAPLVFRPRELHADPSMAQTASHPESQQHASSYMRLRPLLPEQARPDFCHQMNRNLVLSLDTHVQGPTALASQHGQCMPIRIAHAASGM